VNNEIPKMQPLLLTAIEPIFGALRLWIPGILVQAVFNLLWTGGLRLFKIQLRIPLRRIFWSCFLFCSLFTTVVAVHNTIGPFTVVEGFRAMYDANTDNSRIQPLEMVLFWTFISLLATLLFILRRKKRETGQHGENGNRPDA
jgi:hypothetical protein